MTSQQQFSREFHEFVRDLHELELCIHELDVLIPEVLSEVQRALIDPQIGNLFFLQDCQTLLDHWQQVVANRQIKSDSFCCLYNEVRQIYGEISRNNRKQMQLYVLEALAHKLANTTNRFKDQPQSCSSRIELLITKLGHCPGQFTNETELLLRSSSELLSRVDFGQSRAAELAELSNRLAVLDRLIKTQVGNEEHLPRVTSRHHIAWSYRWTLVFVEDDYKLTIHHDLPALRGLLPDTVERLREWLEPRGYQIDARYFHNIADAEQGLMGLIPKRKGASEDDLNKAVALVLDLGLPLNSAGQHATRENGIALLRKIREEWKLSWPVFVFSTPTGFGLDWEDTWHLGITDYLLKGDDNQNLAGLLRDIITEQPGPIACEPQENNANAFQIGEHVIELPPESGLLLEFLLERGQVTFKELADFKNRRHEGYGAKMEGLESNRSSLEEADTLTAAQGKISTFWRSNREREDSDMLAHVLADPGLLGGIPVDLESDEMDAWLAYLQACESGNLTNHELRVLLDRQSLPSNSGRRINVTQAVNDLRNQVDARLRERGVSFHSRRDLVISTDIGYKVHAKDAKDQTNTPGPMRVLLVEDDILLGGRIVEGLPAELYDVRSVVSIAQALQLVERGRLEQAPWQPDILALDMVLPLTQAGEDDIAEMKYDLCGAATIISALLPELPGARAVVFSAHGLTDESTRELRALGVDPDYFIPKERSPEDELGLFAFLDELRHKLHRLACQIQYGYRVGRRLRIESEEKNIGKLLLPLFHFTVPRVPPRADGKLRVTLRVPSLSIDQDVELRYQQARLLWCLAQRPYASFSAEWLKELMCADFPAIVDVTPGDHVINLRRRFEPIIERRAPKDVDSKKYAKAVMKTIIAESDKSYHLNAEVVWHD